MVSCKILNLNQMQNHIMEKPFPVPCIYELTLKQELDRLEDFRVM